MCAARSTALSVTFIFRTAAACRSSGSRRARFAWLRRVRSLESGRVRYRRLDHRDRIQHHAPTLRHLLAADRNPVAEAEAEEHQNVRNADPITQGRDAQWPTCAMPHCQSPRSASRDGSAHPPRKVGAELSIVPDLHSQPRRFLDTLRCSKTRHSMSRRKRVGAGGVRPSDPNPVIRLHRGG